VDLIAAAAARFSTGYAAARQRFRIAAEKAGGSLRSYDNPNRGPDGEALATDCAWFGPADAEKVLVILSGTHGVEGFCGAGVQLDWLEEGNAGALPAGHGALLVHAVNPHGFAWIRRVTEENVDLNRNFVDFAAPLPANNAYVELADALVPRAFTDAEWQAAEVKIAAYCEAHGQNAFHAARSAGQYTHPDGVFYGGAAPTWARRTEEAIIADYRFVERRHAAVIDLHTGLGPFGYGELIVTRPLASPSGGRFLAWYDCVTQLGDPNSLATLRAGLCGLKWEELLGERVTFATIEYGTWPRSTVFRALRRDHCLHSRTNVEWRAERTRQVKADLKEAFFPDSAAWREMVLFRSRQVLRQARDGLAKA
jgi:hypothetical protein